MADHYADGACWWSHLPLPSPEMTPALSDGWLPLRGRAAGIGRGTGSETCYVASALAAAPDALR